MVSKALQTRSLFRSREKQLKTQQLPVVFLRLLYYVYLCNIRVAEKRSIQVCVTIYPVVHIKIMCQFYHVWQQNNVLITSYLMLSVSGKCLISWFFLVYMKIFVTCFYRYDKIIFRLINKMEGSSRYHRYYKCNYYYHHLHHTQFGFDWVYYGNSKFVWNVPVNFK